MKCWRIPIFPGRHQPSIVGTSELNYRVRNGNGWTLTVKNTNYFIYENKHSLVITQLRKMVTRGRIELPLPA